jgi:hypothetical protein
MSLSRPRHALDPSELDGEPVPVVESVTANRMSRRAPRRGGHILPRLFHIVVVVGTVVGVLAATFGGKNVASAAPQPGVQNVSAQMSTDGSVSELTSSTAYQSDSGAVESTTLSLDPSTDGQKLPARVQTAWWLGDRSGTDLSDLMGATGRIVIEISVQNLWTTPQEVTVTSGGAKYRQYSLVSTPLTITASAHLGANQLGNVVTVGDSADPRATNGVASVATANDTVVQWATILAPPTTLGTAVFRLVVNADNFKLPTFDIMAQAGVVTDPSMQNLFSSTMQANQSTSNSQQDTINAVMHVSDQISQAQSYVNQVYTSLSQDASTLGSRTYSDLQSGSAAVLAQIQSTQSQLNDLASQSQSQIETAQGSTTNSLQDMRNNLNNDVLGSTTGYLPLTESSISGCDLTLPKLGDGAAPTLASSIRLMQAQLGVFANAFASPTPAPPGSTTPDPSSDNCRAALENAMQQAVGDSSQLDPVTHLCPASPGGNSSLSIVCAIGVAENNVGKVLNDVQNNVSTLTTDVSGAGTSSTSLSGQVTLLAANLRSLKLAASDASKNLDTGTQSINGDISLLDNRLDAAENSVDTLRGTVDATMAPATNADGTVNPDYADSLTHIQDVLNSMLDPTDGIVHKISVNATNALTDVGNASTAVGSVDGYFATANSDVSDISAAASQAALAQGTQQDVWAAAQAATSAASTPDVLNPNWAAWIGETVSTMLYIYHNSPTAQDQQGQCLAWKTMHDSGTDETDVTQVRAWLSNGLAADPNCPVDLYGQHLVTLIDNVTAGNTTSQAAQKALSDLQKAMESATTDPNPPDPNADPHLPNPTTSPTAAMATALQNIQSAAASASDAYASAQPSMAAASGDLDGARDDLNDILLGANGNVTTLGNDLGTVQETATALGHNLQTISTELNTLYVAPADPANPNPDPADALSKLGQQIDQLKELTQAPTDGSTPDPTTLAGIQQALDIINTSLGSMFTDTVQVTGSTACPDPTKGESEPDLSEMPGAGTNDLSADSVIWLTNRIGCQSATLGTDVTTLNANVTTALNGVTQAFDTAIDSSHTALTDSVATIDGISDQLVTQLNTETGSIASQDLSTIDTVAADNTDKVNTLIDSFKSSTDSVVTDLMNEVDASTADLTSAQQLLNQDFAAVLDSLGSTDPNSQVGLLGQLHTSTGTAKIAQTVLVGVAGTTTNQTNVLSSNMSSLSLQAAQYQASQDMLKSLPTFPGVPNGVSVSTVFSYHIDR